MTDNEIIKALKYWQKFDKEIDEILNELGVLQGDKSDKFSFI